jgi:porin
MTGEWAGARTYLRNQGIELFPTLIFDEVWNLFGGKARRGGEFLYLVDVVLQIKSHPLFGYEGGLLHADFESHHGERPSRSAVGSYVDVNVIEAPSFDELYELWYRQAFGNNRFWIQVGKTDAYDYFTTTAHSDLFLNAGYSRLPSCPFFPTYPNPAMAVIGSLIFVKELSLTAGVFDGSLATGLETGRHGIFGHFFKDLGKHAFLIGELDVEWGSGRIGLGGWKNTAEFQKFDGGTKKGMAGVYATLDQRVYTAQQEDAGLFFIWGSGPPEESPVHYYYGGGLEWKGYSSSRPHDILGLGMSRVKFSSKAGFSKSNETAYEAFYHFHIFPWTHIEPDLQYIVHPGGRSLSNAIVFTLNLRLVL